MKAPMNEPAQSRLLKAAGIVSALGHPLLMGSLISSLVFFHLFVVEKALFLSGFVIVLISLPMAAWNYFKSRSGAYTNFDVSIRSQRPSLYLVLVGLLTLASLFAWISEQPKAFNIGLSVCLGMVLLSFAVNTMLKTSLHVAMAFFMAFGLLTLTIYGGIALLLMAVLVGFSRLLLKRHSVPEVISGMLIGSAAGATLVYLVYWSEQVIVLWAG